MNSNGLYQYFFVTLFNSCLGNINEGVMKNILPIAEGILIVMFLLSVYEAFAKGSGPRALIMSLFKCAACQLILSNWFRFFTDITNGFSAVGTSILSTDPALTYFQSIGALNQSGDGWASILTLDIVTILNHFVVIFTILIFLLCVWVFGYLYILWGSILFAVGPFMVALYPSGATGSFTKGFFRGMASWAAWPILYAILGAVNINIQKLSGDFGQPFPESSGLGSTIAGQIHSAILGVLLIICMIMIPFLAAAIMRADSSGLGSAMKAMLQLKSFGGLAAGAAKGGLSGLATMATGTAGGASGAAGGAGGGGSTPTGESDGGGGSAGPPPATPPSSGGKTAFNPAYPQMASAGRSGAPSKSAVGQTAYNPAYRR